VRHSVLLLGILTLGACVEQTAAVETAEVATPQIVLNALSPDAFANSELTTTALNGTSAVAMARTSSARRVLEFAATCALDATQAIDFAVDDVQYHVAGMMGVAPAWTTRALTASEAAWVSACVASRVNLTSSTVEISARGDNAGYDITAGELADYQLEEGAFWGNAFTDLGPVMGYACNGIDQTADDTVGDLPLRECAEWDGVSGSNASPCGFHYAGLCSTACSTTTAPYSGCSFLGGSASASVVTAFLPGSR
jgi:hypothetical protein